MKTMDELKVFYESDLKLKLGSFEKRRKKICAVMLVTVILFLMLLAVVAIVFPGLRQPPQGLVFPGIIGIVITVGVLWFVSRGFVQDFKLQVVQEVVKFCDPSLNYSPKGHISQHQFQGSQIFKHHIDRFSGEDLVSGQMDKTAIQFSELHAEYKTTTTNSKGQRRTQWHTIFKGLYFVADFNKNFSGRTVVLPDTAEKLFGFLGKKLQEMNLSRDQLVKLEDPEFEKMFAVYGTDQVEARYILSTSLMKRITDFKKKMKSPIYLSFTGSNVHIAISQTRNMFEPRIFRSVLDFSLIRGYLEDLQLFLDIVDDLNLNTRIWTKA